MCETERRAAHWMQGIGWAAGMERLELLMSADVEKKQMFQIAVISVRTYERFLF